MSLSAKRASLYGLITIVILASPLICQETSGGTLSGLMRSTSEGGVRGRIVDADGRGIPDLLIQACSDQLCIPFKTDDQGMFSVSLPPGAYSLTVGVKTHAVEFTVSARRTVTLTDFKL